MRGNPTEKRAMPKSKEQLAELQNLPVAELEEQLATLEPADLAALRELEQGSDKPRATALAAIEKAEAARAEAGANNNQNDNAGPAAARAAKAPAEKAPAWQSADYNGPLTVPQAEWRNHNLKPAREVRTK